MKTIVLISIIYLECISGLDYPALFTLNKINLWRPNKFFQLVTPNQLTIKQLAVIKEITEEDKLSVDYRIESSAGLSLHYHDNASFCGDDAGTEAGSIAEVMRKILGIQEMNCPIPKQINTILGGVVRVEMQKTDVDTNCAKFFIDVDIKVDRSPYSLSKMEFSVVPSPCKGNKKN